MTVSPSTKPSALANWSSLPPTIVAFEASNVRLSTPSFSVSVCVPADPCVRWIAIPASAFALLVASLIVLLSILMT